MNRGEIYLPDEIIIFASFVNYSDLLGRNEVILSMTLNNTNLNTLFLFTFVASN